LRVLQEIGGCYNNLELNAETGKRGDRAAYLEHNLAVLCGSDASTVVNNCAAALVLILKHYCTDDRPEVVISRGELIQIGGGFRIPEILEASGAHLREVGTTNRTTVGDYVRAIGPSTGLILRVHRSNFFMEGFVDAPPMQELVTAAKKKRIPVVEDLGSGALIRTERALGVQHEPMPSESLKAGVDLVCFSGDKLMGGPQAGVIAGKRRAVSALKKHPLYRAMRCDKLAIASMQVCVDAYLDGQERDAIPVVELLSAPVNELQHRAGAIRDAVVKSNLEVSVSAGSARVGGGTLPRVSLDSVVLELRSARLSAAALSSRLRAAKPPVVCTISGNCVRIDLRTVFPAQDAELAAVILEAGQDG
jgi:L-seryl-tRNA(Ser) seleniumtransferase